MYERKPMNEAASVEAQLLGEELPCLAQDLARDQTSLMKTELLDESEAMGKNIGSVPSVQNLANPSQLLGERQRPRPRPRPASLGNFETALQENTLLSPLGASPCPDAEPCIAEIAQVMSPLSTPVAEPRAPTDAAGDNICAATANSLTDTTAEDGLTTASEPGHALQSHGRRQPTAT